LQQETEDKRLANLFSGLEALGLKNLSNMDVYDEKEKEVKAAVEKEEKQPFDEADYIYDKTYICPVCDKKFKSKTVKTGRSKLERIDSDLRPVYQFVDPLKYDAIVCPHCGFAALSRFFKYVTSMQASLIRSNISSSFRGIKEDKEVYTYDDAIVRHKLVLVNTIVKKAKTSERAYTCLKIAWLLRGKAESLEETDKDYQKQVEALAKEEMEFIKNAYEGFEEAFRTETFPMCGMDENTVTLLVAELARKIGKTEESGRWISKILTARDANERIKAKAREIKELIQEDKNS
jgi:hypothetical protein